MSRKPLILFTSLALAMAILVASDNLSPVSATSCAPESSKVIDGNTEYTILQFKTVGTCTWQVPAGVAIEVAVVGAGGGGGFGSNGAGGGAGEVLVTGSASLSSGSVIGTSVTQDYGGQSIAISIGTGGTSGEPNGSTKADALTAWNNNSSTSRPGGDGGATSFGTVVARGGGGGGGNTRVAGASGGSGGGGATGGSGGGVGNNAIPSGWTSFKNVGSAGSAGNGGGAGSAGSTKGGNGVTVFGKKVAGGGGGWGKLGSENSLTDSTLGGNGRLTTPNWPYAGNAPNYTSDGVANTGTGGGGGATGGSGIVIVRYIAPPSILKIGDDNDAVLTQSPVMLVDPRSSSVAIPFVRLSAATDSRICVDLFTDSSKSTGIELKNTSAASSFHRLAISNSATGITSSESNTVNSSTGMKLTGTRSNVASMLNPSVSANESYLRLFKPDAGWVNGSVLRIRADYATGSDCSGVSDSQVAMDTQIKIVGIELNQKNDVTVN